MSFSTMNADRSTASEDDPNQVILEDFVAQYYGALELEQSEALQRKIASDLHLQAECEALEQTIQLTRTIGMIEPSAQFRVALQSRLAQSIKKNDTSQATPENTESRSPSVRRTAPSSSRQLRSTSRSASSNATTEIHLHGRKSESWKFFRSMSAAAAIVLIVLIATYFIPLGEKPVREDGILVMTQGQLWKERQAAARWETLLQEDALKLPAELADVEALYLMPLDNVESGARCVVAYSEAELEDVKLSFKDREPEALKDALASTVRVSVHAGVLRVPGRLLPKLNGESRLAILKLNGRMEIWGQHKLNRHLNTEPIIELAPPASQQPIESVDREV